MPRTKCYDARPYNQEIVTNSDNQALQRTKKLSSHHKIRGNLRKMQAHLKPYIPSDKQDQVAKKDLLR